MKILKDLLENRKMVNITKKDMEESKEEMRKEFFETWKQHELKILKLEHLYNINPLSDEIDILKKEIEASFMRVNNLHRDMRSKYQELELKFVRALEKGRLIHKIRLKRIK